LLVLLVLLCGLSYRVMLLLPLILLDLHGTGLVTDDVVRHMICSAPTLAAQICFGAFTGAVRC